MNKSPRRAALALCVATSPAAFAASPCPAADTAARAALDAQHRVQRAPNPESDRAISAFLGFEASIRPFGAENAAPSYAGPLTEARYAKAPIHLLTTASLARLKALHPEGTPDPRRFRPNIVVDMAPVEGAFPETEWIGRKLAVGDLELTVSEPCRRCGFTIIAQDGFDTDPGILRNLVRHNQHNLGVYCTVDRPARVEIGAPMRFV